MSKIDPINWDPPAHIGISDRKFLVDRAETINGVMAGAYLTCGQILLQVKRKFQSDPQFERNWFKKWIEDTLPFSHATALYLAGIAEKAESDPQIVKLSLQVAQASMRLILELPFKYRTEVFNSIEQGSSVTQSQIRELKQTTEVQCEAAQEAVTKIQSQIAQYSLQLATSSDATVRSNANDQLNRYEKKSSLQKAVQKLSDLKREVASKDSKLTAQEVVVAQLQRQLRQRDVQVEQAVVDPQAKRKRAIARTVVDANRSLDLLLSTLDRYATDKDDIGDEAIKSIERKMTLIKSKLKKIDDPLPSRNRSNS